mmetsp:Transcript_11870/g.19037  ORF Transcript_11870/g.19037 Transcript_11870/m.19037 type:complete len:159 (+) Transcript_11870:1170-1646(+)
MRHGRCIHHHLLPHHDSFVPTSIIISSHHHCRRHYDHTLPATHPVISHTPANMAPRPPMGWATSSSLSNYKSSDNIDGLAQQRPKQKSNLWINTQHKKNDTTVSTGGIPSKKQVSTIFQPVARHIDDDTQSSMHMSDVGSHDGNNDVQPWAQTSVENF